MGVIGLISHSWEETSVLNQKAHKMEKYIKIGRELCTLLKDDYHCDYVIAITHLLNDEDMSIQNKNTGIDLCKQ